MSLDTEATTTAPETTPAPAEIKSTTPDVLKEQPNEAERIEAAETDELRKVYRRAEAKRAEDRQPEPEEKPKAETAKRDPATGKYLPLKEAVEVGEADKADKADKAEPAKDAKKADDQKPAPETVAKKPAVEAPKHWSDKQKAEFSKLDAETQESVANELKQLRDNSTKAGRVLKEYEPVAKVLQEHKGLFDKRGIGYDQGVAALLNAQAMLDDPARVKEAYARLGAALNAQHGFDVRSQQATETQDSDDDWSDPQVKHLAQEVAAERERNNRLEGMLQNYFQHQAQQQQEAKHQASLSTVESFVAGKEDFEALEDEIFDRVRMIRAIKPDMPGEQVLAQAYREARALSPATQERMLDERVKAQAAEVEKARRAAAHNVTSEPDPSMAASEIEQMRRIYRKNHAA